jgi:hypothetical protein
MSRIYYEPKYRPAPTFGAPAPESGYVEKIAATIPGEIVAGYMAVVAIVTALGKVSAGMTLGLIVFFAAADVALLLKSSQNDPPGSPKIVFIVMSVLSFFAWVYAVSGKVFLGGLYEEPWPQLAPVLMVVLSRVIPYSK